MIPRELIKTIRAIEIHSSRLAASQLAGHYHSVFKGRGIAFSEVRPYQPGDDVRVIDWNVSARMNEPHVKLFTEERDRTVMLLVDASASGLVGTRAQSKRAIAAEVAALLAFAAIHNNDRVGLVIFTDEVELFVPPKKGRKHVLRVIREILGHRPRSRRTSLGAALDFLGKALRRKSVAFLVSDFLDQGWEQPLCAALRRHDVIPVIITDPIEEELPRLGLVTFEDAETGEMIELDTLGPEGALWGALAARARAHREAALRRLSVDFVDLRTDRPYGDALVAFFRARARRMHRG